MSAHRHDCVQQTSVGKSGFEEMTFSGDLHHHHFAFASLVASVRTTLLGH